MKDWTIMIYLAGDNSLSDEMIWALKEIYRVGTGENCNVIVQIDPSATDAEPRRYALSDLDKLAGLGCDLDGILEAVKKAELPAPIQENSASPEVLKDFMLSTISDDRFRADHYMLVLSGHGTGITGGLLDDQNPWGRLSIPGLKDVLEHTAAHLDRHIDILGLDLCTMSMVEVADEVRNSVDYIVGSEGFVDNAGWPYHRLLESMREKYSPTDLAREIVNIYYTYYLDYLVARVSADQAAVTIRKEEWQRKLIQPFTHLVKLLCEALKKEENNPTNRIVSDALVLAHWKAQSFNNEQHTDLYDFCLCLKNSLVHADPDANEKPEVNKPLFGARDGYDLLAICTACDRVIGGVEGVVLNALCSGSACQHAHGLSIYFPWSEVAVNYLDTDFARRTGWGEFLKLYVDRTCRSLRNDDRRAENERTLGSTAVECEQGVVGVGGYAVYRSGGPNSARSGGPNSPRSGGPNRPRTGELSVDDLLRLSCMKNWPVRYLRPKHMDQVEIISRAQANHVRKCNETISGMDEVHLSHWFSGLPPETQEKIRKMVDLLK